MAFKVTSPDGLLLLIGMFSLAIGVGYIFGAGFGWLGIGAAFVISAYTQ